MPRESIWRKFFRPYGEYVPIHLGRNVPYINFDKMTAAARIWARTQEPPVCVHAHKTRSPNLTEPFSEDLERIYAQGVLRIALREHCHYERCRQKERDDPSCGYY